MALGNLMSLSKNEIIRGTLKKTKERRKTQTCKQYELKIDSSHLNDETLNQIFWSKPRDMGVCFDLVTTRTPE
jgi:hypothetical protein